MQSEIMMQLDEVNMLQNDKIYFSFEKEKYDNI